MTAPRDDVTADPQSIIAALRQQLQAALAEKASLAASLAVRDTDFGERIEQQAATIDVLKVMSASPGDPRPVFDLIASRARDLCDGYGVTVFEFDGTLIHQRASTGVSEDPTVRKAFAARFPAPPTRSTAAGRAIMEGRIIRIDDLEAEPGLDPITRSATAKSTITIPLMRGELAVGAIALGSRERGGFSESQTGLLETFAEQAVIAIGSAETYRALQTRTGELTARDADNRALIARQEASIEVLRAISTSPDDPQPVFDLIVRWARDLCGSYGTSVLEYDGALLHMRAISAPNQEAAATLMAAFPRAPSRDTVPGRVALSGQIVRVADATADPSLIQPTRSLGARSMLGVPLMNEDRVIGVVMLSWPDADSFNDDAVALVQSFAAQAVIAIAGAKTLRELRERDAENNALIARQSASIEVLRAISLSAADPQPVFDLIVKLARDLCGAYGAAVLEYDGDLLHMRAISAPNEEVAARVMASFPRLPGPETVSGRVALSGQIVRILDARADPILIQSTRDLGTRSMLGVPLLSEGGVIGVVTLTWADADSYDAAAITVVQSFAEQAVIAVNSAAALGELRKRTADLQQSLEYQTATSEVLKVISQSTFDLQPVLDTVAQAATRLCDADQAIIFRRDGDMRWLVANHGYGPEYETAMRARGAFLQDPNSPVPGARAERERVPVHIHDTKLVPGFQDLAVQLAGVRTALGVPLLRGDEAIGSIILSRRRVEPFTDSQIELVRTFADQAVIAIENTRLITEQREALEQQTATAEVLRVINANPGDLEPVFDTILEKAHALCGAAVGSLMTYDGEYIHRVAMHGYPAAYEAVPQPPIRPSAGLESVIRGERFHQVEDIRTLPVPEGPAGDVPRAFRDLSGVRTFLTLPLRKDGAVIGFLSVYRQEVRLYSEPEIILLESFAAQAGIAIENARLLNELRQSTAALAQRNTEFGERIEQQSATIDVLKVMSASPGDPQPVFDLIVERTRTVCNAEWALLTLLEDGAIHVRSMNGLNESRTREISSAFPVPVNEASTHGRVILSCDNVQIDDILTDPDFGHKDLGRWMRATLAVPLMRGGVAIGTIGLARAEPGAFSDSQTSLLRAFAEQAVIAIGSAETYRALQTRTADLQESLEYQTATSDVLKVISRSTFDLQPVLDTVVETAVRLCEADFAHIFTRDGEVFRFAATCAFSPEFATLLQDRSIIPGQGSAAARALLERRPIQIEDVTAYPGYAWSQAITIGGVRTALGVPLMRDDVVMGVIGLGRNTVRPFTDRQIALVSTFADQAVIAMDNARLINEQREALEQQTATAEVLQVINASAGNLQPVFDAILEKSLRICQPAFGSLYTFHGDHGRLLATSGMTAALADYRDRNPNPGYSANTLKLLETKRPVHQLDIRDGEGYRSGHSGPRSVADLGGARTLLLVPIIKEQTVIGGFQIYRREVRAFSDKEIALVENFAAQAVIAMENARLITEQREALEQQTATSEVLQVINASPGDLTPVFEAILEKAHNLCGADFGGLLTYDGNSFRMVTERNLPPAWANFVRSHMRVTPNHPLSRLVRGEPLFQIEDVRELVAQFPDEPAPRAMVELGGIRTILYIPLRNDRILLGIMTAYRQEVRPFTGKQIALLENFAAQAVIAMENARLIDEIRAARDNAETTLRELKAAQANLVQAEKMASLGQLTAGIAHEIKNPLNFVNNFAELSVDLLAELKDAIAPAEATLNPDQRDEVDELVVTLTSNLKKITEHGKRADGIVKAMLEHSRGASGERRIVDINALANEALNLAYHGARAQDQSFNITLERALGDGIAPIMVNPQDLTRVFLNLFSNGFYAAKKRASNGAAPDFSPTLRLTTRDVGDTVEIRVRDNGTGVPDGIRDKLFQPFFTTKPTGEGTGLGLSITYDIVTKAHGGTIAVDSEVGEFTEFVVTLPRTMFASEGGRA